MPVSRRGNARRKLANIGHLGVKELRSLWREYVLLLLILWTFSMGVYTAATAMPESLHQACSVATVPGSLAAMPSRKWFAA